MPPNKMNLVKGRTPYARHVCPTPTFHIVLKAAAAVPSTAKDATEENNNTTTNGTLIVQEETEEADEAGQYYFDLDYQFQSPSSSPPITTQAGDSSETSFGTRLKPLPQVLYQQQGGPQTRTYQIDLNQNPNSATSNATSWKTDSNNNSSQWIPSGLIQKGPRSILELKLKADRFMPLVPNVVEGCEESPEHDDDDDDNNTDTTNPPSEIELQLRHVALIPCRAGGPMRRKITSQTSVSIPLLLHPTTTDDTSSSPTRKHPVLMQVQLGHLERVDADHSQFQIKLAYMDPETQEPILQDLDVQEQNLMVEWKHVVDVLPTIAEYEDSAMDDDTDDTTDADQQQAPQLLGTDQQEQEEDKGEEEDKYNHEEKEGVTVADIQLQPPPLPKDTSSSPGVKEEEVGKDEPNNKDEGKDDTYADKPQPPPPKAASAPVALREKDQAPRMPARRRVVESSQQHRDPTTPDPSSLIKVDKMPSRPRRRGSGSDSEGSISAPTPTTTTGSSNNLNNMSATTTSNTNRSRSSINNRTNQTKRKKKRRYRIKSLKLRHLPTIVEEERDVDEDWFTHGSMSVSGGSSVSSSSSSDGEADPTIQANSSHVLANVDQHTQENNTEENERKNKLQSVSSPALVVVDDLSSCNTKDMSTPVNPASEDCSESNSESSSEPLVEPSEVTLPLSDDEDEPIEEKQQEETPPPSAEEVPETPEPSKPTEPTKKKHNNTLTKDKGRSMLMWYARMGNPSKDVMKRKILKLPPELRDFTVEDVEALPWVFGGAMLNVNAVNKLFVSGS